MADEAESGAHSAQEVLPGSEPGASRNSMLVASDSFEDVENYLDELNAGEEASVEGSTCPPALPARSRAVAASGREIPSTELPTHTSKSNSATYPAGDTTHLSDKQDYSSNNIPVEELSQMCLGNGSTAAGQSTGDCADVSGSVKPVLARALSTQADDEVEYEHSEEWKQHRKHIFILSDAGKPIYSRYGEEDRLVTMMGILQALVSFIHISKDSIRCIVAGEHKFVFLVREHLILVCVARTHESMQHILLQLTYVYNQLLSVLTLSQLSRIFEQRHNYDLRRLLAGAEKFFDNLLNLMDCDPSFFLGAVRCLPLESPMRDTIAQSIAQHAKVKDLVFAILLAENQLITLVRMRKYFLHPLDLHLIFNLVSASESFKTAESWTPICLPKFDSGGYLHAHISYLDESCQTCLLLLTVDKDLFFTLSECRDKIQEKMKKHSCLKAIGDSLRRKKYKIGQVGIADLRHFLYKSRSTAQFTSPEFEAPFLSQEDKDRVFSLYQYLHSRIHSSARPLKILFHVGKYETLLGWVTSGFELYAVFSPLVTKLAAINSVNKLLKWIKKEEDRLFILNSPTF